MKKIISLLLTFIMCISLCSCDSRELQKAEFDNTILVDDFEVNMSSDIITAEQLNGDESRAEFLSTDLTVGDGVTVAKEGNILVVVSYSITNTAKTKKTFSDIVSLNYDDYIYKADEQYWISDKTLESWHKFTSVNVNPLLSLECKSSFAIPAEVINNKEKPLKLIIADYEYTIR